MAQGTVGRGHRSNPQGEHLLDSIHGRNNLRDLKVVEDACEAHGGEWQGRKVGALGDLGCFSFQTGKSLTCGEGGAILGRDPDLMDRCFSFHNLGRPYGSVVCKPAEGCALLGSKCRMAEYLAAILLAQMKTFEAECRQRSENSECPQCDQLVVETVGFHQRMLLGPRQDMDDIANAIAKVYEHRRKLTEHTS